MHLVFNALIVSILMLLFFKKSQNTKTNQQRKKKKMHLYFSDLIIILEWRRQILNLKTLSPATQLLIKWSTINFLSPMTVVDSSTTRIASLTSLLSISSP